MNFLGGLTDETWNSFYNIFAGSGNSTTTASNGRTTSQAIRAEDSLDLTGGGEVRGIENPLLLPDSTASEPIQRMLEIAASQVGVTETEGLDNYGPEVKQYLATTGLKEGNHWCAAFMSWIEQKARAAGISFKAFDPTARSKEFAKQAHEYGHFHFDGESTRQPQPGDMMILNRGNTMGLRGVAAFEGEGHIGIVNRIYPGPSGDMMVETIEGNSSDAVVKRSYSMTQLRERGLLGFADTQGMIQSRSRGVPGLTA